MDWYTYQKLEDARDFMLLHIKSPSAQYSEDTDKTPPLPGLEVFHASLDKAPSFQTVSYTWGTTVRDRGLPLTNGKHLAVTNTLMTALPSLAAVSNKEYLWVDQFCINMDDLQERNAQVGMMAEIYRTAGDVLVWLGQQNESTQYYHRLIDELPVPHRTWSLTTDLEESEWKTSEEEEVRLYCWVWNQTNERHATGWNPEWDENHSTLERLVAWRDYALPKQLSDELVETWTMIASCIEEVFQSPWVSAHRQRTQRLSHACLLRSQFSRVWVWQEVQLSQTVRFLVGTTAISAWQLLRLPRIFISCIVFHSIYRNVEQQMHAAIRARFNLSTIMRRWQPIGEVSLFDMFCHLREGYVHGQTTDPRDTVFGLLGICSSFDSSKVEPDYSISQKMVFAITMKQIIASRGDLAVLALCDGIGESLMEDLPDESSSPIERRRAPSWVANLNSQREEYDDPTFPAVNAESVSAHHSIQMTPWYQLYTRGTRIGSVELQLDKFLCMAIACFSTAWFGAFFHALPAEELQSCLSRLPGGPRESLNLERILRACLDVCRHWLAKENTEGLCIDSLVQKFIDAPNNSNEDRQDTSARSLWADLDSEQLECAFKTLVLEDHGDIGPENFHTFDECLQTLYEAYIEPQSIEEPSLTELLEDEANDWRTWFMPIARYYCDQRLIFDNEVRCEHDISQFDSCDEIGCVHNGIEEYIEGLENLRVLPFDELYWCTAGRLVFSNRNVQAGDGIFVLHGCPFPVVLRRSDSGSYQYVGKCHLEGAMGGEMVTWSEEEAHNIVLE